MGTSRIVTELGGCTRQLTRYVADASQWHGTFAAEIPVWGDRFRQEYIDGAWHGTGVLGFPEELVRVSLTFEGTGDTSPYADGGLCGFTYAPPFVGVCATASAARPAMVDGRISVGRIGQTIGGSAGRMQFWTRV